MKKISISFLKSIYDPYSTIKKIDLTDANFIHVDIMDGIFVPNKNFDLHEIEELLHKATTPLDVHLMVKDPLKWLPIFTKLKTHYLVFHIEAVKNPLEVINKIRKSGIRAGIAINPQTKVEKIRELIPYIDIILIMSVKAGAGGQEFQPRVLEKIKELKKYQKNNNFVINVDGGINAENSSLIDSEIISVGSFVTMHEDFQEQINKLKQIKIVK